MTHLKCKYAPGNFYWKSLNEVNILTKQGGKQWTIGNGQLAISNSSAIVQGQW